MTKWEHKEINYLRDIVIYTRKIIICVLLRWYQYSFYNYHGYWQHWLSSSLSFLIPTNHLSSPTHWTVCICRSAGMFLLVMSVQASSDQLPHVVISNNVCFTSSWLLENPASVDIVGGRSYWVERELVLNPDGRHQERSALCTHTVWEVKGRGWDVSSGWWARPALLRWGCGGRERETWTEDCWANDLHENESNDYYRRRRVHVTVCVLFMWQRRTLFWRQGGRLWQGAGGSSVQDPFSILIIGWNICWWHTESLASQEDKTRIVKICCTAWSLYWCSLHKAPPAGKAVESLLSSLPERRWPREGQHRESGRRNLLHYVLKVVFAYSLKNDCWKHYCPLCAELLPCYDKSWKSFRTEKSSLNLFEDTAVFAPDKLRLQKLFSSAGKQDRELFKDLQHQTVGPFNKSSVFWNIYPGCIHQMCRFWIAKNTNPLIQNKNIISFMML